MPTTSCSVSEDYHFVLICGSRNWGHKRPIRLLILELMGEWGKKLVIIEGGARGADTIAHDLALSQGIPVMRFDAPWDYLPRAAGPVRNKWMAKIGKPHEAYAFHLDIESSRGTKNMVELLKKVGIPCKVIDGL